MYTTYRIVGTFRGRKLSRIGREQEICKETFVDCWVPLIWCGCGCCYSWRKLSWIDTKSRNYRKFSSSKVSHYTVSLPDLRYACVCHLFNGFAKHGRTSTINMQDGVCDFDAILWLWPIIMLINSIQHTKVTYPSGVHI